MNQNNNGALLLFLSDYKDGNSTITFHLRHSKNSQDLSFTGAQTNEAPVSYLLYSAVSDGHTIERIICVLSRKCYEEPQENTAWQRFQSFVKEYCDKTNIPVPEFVHVCYDFCITDGQAQELLSDSDSKRALRIYNKVYETAYEKDLRYFYIDFTGGLRDINYLFTMIIRNLKWIGAECSRIVYASKPSAELVRLDKTYYISKIIDSVSMFINSGNAEIMHNVFNELIPDDGTESRKIMYDMIVTIKKFTDTISVCNTELIDAVIEELSEAVKASEKLSTQSIENNIYLELFRSMLPNIKQSMLPASGCKMSVLEIVKWCLDKRMIQQALTIFTEKMPDYYIEHHVCDGFVEKICPHEIDGSMFSSWQAETFYKTLFDETECPNMAEKGVELITLINTQSNQSKEYKYSVFTNLLESYDYTGNNILASAFKRLAKFIRGRYNINPAVQNSLPLCKKPISDKECYGYFAKNDTNTPSLKQFIHHLINKDKEHAIMHYFIFDDINEFQKYRNEVNSFNAAIIGDSKVQNLDKRKLNIVKKIKSCINVERGILEEEVKTRLSKLYPDETLKERLTKTADIMRVYHAIKFIRNHTNHALNSSTDSYEKIVQDYYQKGTFIGTDFKSSLPPIDITEMNADKVVALLKYAISISDMSQK